MAMAWSTPRQRGGNSHRAHSFSASAYPDAADTDGLKRVHDELQTEILLCLAQLGAGYASPRELAEEHGELLARLEARKPAAAERAIRSHFERALSWLQAEGERTPPA